ncbi:MAG: hypothetical protein AAF363_04450 [Bacteroidota bacterium]
MQRVFGALFFCFCITHLTNGQSKEHFRIEKEGEGDQLIHFHFNSPSGTSFIKVTSDEDPVNIYGHIDRSKTKSMFYDREIGVDKHVYLDLEESTQNSFSSSVSFGMLSDKKGNENDWKIYLSKSNEFGLDLNYGLGKADIDLSGLATKRLNLNSGSADVVLGYQEGFSNGTSMDTMNIKMGFGSVLLMNANLAKAKQLIADIGFGNLRMDLSDEEVHEGKVKASIGAGSLTVNVPKSGVPVKVVINNSPLCRVKFAKGFQEIERNVFINKAYQSDSESALLFNLDVALGSITFQNKP